MVFLVFQSVGASASKPNTGANEYNHAYYRNGGKASSSGSSGSNTPAMAIDQNENGTVTYWQSSTTTGSLAVSFPAKAYVNEVHAHFQKTKYPALTLYFDTSGNGAYEPAEKVWSTTANGALDVVVPTPTAFTLGMKLTIDAKVGNGKTMIAEFEAYLRSDTDGDGLTNDVEARTVYYYQSAAVGLPLGVPDVGSNNTTLTANRLAGVPFRSLADFTVDHGLKDQLSASLSYWDGGAWVETPVWDPGKWLTKPTILYPAGGALLSGVVQVRASVKQPSLLASVEFFVDGASKNTTTVPSGNDYLWSWNTAGYASGSHVLRARSHDVWGAYADADVSVYVDSGAPIVSITASETIVCPQEVTISGWASDLNGLDRVTFVGVLYDLSGPTYWSGSQLVWVSQTTTYTITAVDMLGNSASASVGVRVPQQCFPEAPAASEAAASIPAVRPNEGFFLSPGSVTITAGTGKTATEAGYSVVGSSHRVVVNLTNPLSGLTAAERSGRIAAPGISSDVLNRDQVWRLTITDWASGIQGSITAFSVRIEETTSLAARDTDSDSLPDGTEALSLGTSPVAEDTDVDGLTDDYEIKGHSLTLWNGGSSSIVTGLTSDPTRWDTDADGLADGQERGFVMTGQSKVISEVGRVTGVTTTCTDSGVVRVYLRNRYTDPIVIAEPPTRADTALGVIRVSAVTDHTFAVCFQEWQDDGVHTPEAVDYLVVEAGNHVLADGTLVEAGTASVGTTAVSVSFREPFADVPVVLAQTQSFANIVPAEVRILNLVGTSFSAHLRTPSGTGVAETVGYVAVSPQADPSSLASWTRGTIGMGTATSGQVTFPKAFASTPRFLAWFATENGNADVGLRLSPLTNVSASYFRDYSGTTVAETLHYFAFAQSMNLTARMTTRPNGTGSADTDGDGLSDGLEVSSYGSNPTLKDTDADGIPDNVEVTDRTITIPVNGTARTFTVKTSPTSDDTDADGVKDPDELSGVLDHRNLFLDMETQRTSGILRDLSGNAADGTIVGATCTSSVAGRVGYACDFGGSGARVRAADAPNLDMTSSFTILAWVYPTTTSQAAGAGIVAKGTGGGGETYAVDVSGGYFRTFFWKGGSAYIAQGTTQIAKNTWYLVTAVYDGPSGTLSLFVNGGLQRKTTGVPSSLAPNDHELSIGSREASSTSGYTLGFVGRIDDAQMADRPLSPSEVSGYYNVTSPTTTPLVAVLDMETLTTSGSLFDFSGKAHPGVVSGTSIAEGRSGFARKFSGGNDGVALSGTNTVSFTGGVSASLYVLVSSYPTTDTPILSRKGNFYLNLTSDGRVMWSIYQKSSIATPLPVPLNRWVRVAVTANSAGSAIFLDGVQAASSTAIAAPLTASTSVVLGYAEGLTARFVGTMDQVLLLNVVPTSSSTLTDLAVRGIQLNPNATDTDADGLADGQELFVKTVKTPKRYPIPDQNAFADGSAWTPQLDLGSGAPGWAITSAMAMVGITHPTMGNLQVDLHRTYGSSNTTLTLRARDPPDASDNNFTSYDLINTAGIWKEDFALPKTWSLHAIDKMRYDAGQIEYLQLQITIRTLPNRADTDADGLNDSEELNLGSDGFQTNPWKADTDGDTIGDSLEYGGWSRSGSTIVSNPSGFHTDPTRRDTDYDGYADGVDRWPVQDAYVEVYVSSFVLVTQSIETSTLYAYPYVILKDAGGNQTVSWAYAGAPCVSLQSGGWVYCSGTIDHTYTIDLPDDAPSATFTVEMRQDRSRYNTGGDINAPISPTGSNVVTHAWTVQDDLSVTNAACGGNGYCLYQSQILVTIGGVDYRNQLWVEVAAHGGTRSDFNVVVPNDYSGVYNVTSGTNVYRRYVGEPRFVEVLINGTTPTAYFVPRSLFFDTKFYVDLKTQAVLQAAPYTKMKGYQNGTTSANSDVIQMAYVFDGLTADEATFVRYALLKNASGVANKTILTWASADWSARNSPYLASLPVELIQAVPLLTWYSSPSHPENIDVAPPAVPWWVQLAMGVASAISETLSYIRSGLVWLGNLVVQFVEALRNFGSWVGDLTSGDPVRVASAVQAAAKALDAFLTWVVDLATSVLKAAISGLTSTMRSLLDLTIGVLVQEISVAIENPGQAFAVVQSIANYMFPLLLGLSLIPVAGRVAEALINVATLGVNWVVSKLVSKTVAEFLVKALASAALTLSAAVIVGEILDSLDWVASTTVEVFKSIGVVVTLTAGVGELAFSIYKLIHVRLLSQSLILRWLGFSAALFSIVLFVLGETYKTGPALFALDMLALLSAAGGILLYVLESEKPAQKAIDLASSVTPVLEKLVVLGSLPVATASLLLHAGQGKWG